MTDHWPKRRQDQIGERAWRRQIWEGEVKREKGVIGEEKIVGDHRNGSKREVTLKGIRLRRDHRAVI